MVDSSNNILLNNSTKLKQNSWNYFQLSAAPSHALLHVRSGIHLYSLDQVPLHQQDNKYITSGYRSYLSAKQCLKSVLIRSNELVNIWTHGGMVFVLLALMVYDQSFRLTAMKTSVLDHLIFLTFNLCIQICMACSAGYHTFNCHVHKKVALRWYAVDLYGITVGMMGCYSIGLYYGFYCVRTLRAFYSAIIFSMILVSGLVMLHPQYMSDSPPVGIVAKTWKTKVLRVGFIVQWYALNPTVLRNGWRRYRITHLTAICVFGLLPTMHWVYVAPKSEIQLFLSSVLIFYSILAIAMLLYLSKFPECTWPGSFNIFGHSHNWWHLLINAAFLYWRNFAFNILQYRLSNQCTFVS